MSPGIDESENFFLRILHSFCIFGPTWILGVHFYTRWVGLRQKIVSRYCPLKAHKAPYISPCRLEESSRLQSFTIVYHNKIVNNINNLTPTLGSSTVNIIDFVGAYGRKHQVQHWIILPWYFLSTFFHDDDILDQNKKICLTTYPRRIW